MARPDFYGPFLKVERAEHHIKKLESIFRRYVRDNMKRLRPKNQRRALKQGRGNIGAEFPKHTPTILGDAVHNLHAALDHAYCVLVLKNDGKIGDFTRFPFGGDRKSLKGSINGQKLKGIPSESVCDFIIDEMQPYKGGKLRLYELHRLDITDKHIVLLPTMIALRISHENPLRFRDAAGNDLGIEIRGIKLMAYQRDKPSVGLVDPGSGSAVMEGNPQNVFEITFPEGEPFGGQSILQTLREMHEVVTRSLSEIERRFF